MGIELRESPEFALQRHMQFERVIEERKRTARELLARKRAKRAEPNVEIRSDKTKVVDRFSIPSNTARGAPQQCENSDCFPNPNPSIRIPQIKKPTSIQARNKPPNGLAAAWPLAPAPRRPSTAPSLLDRQQNDLLALVSFTAESSSPSQPPSSLPHVTSFRPWYRRPKSPKPRPRTRNSQTQPLNELVVTPRGGLRKTENDSPGTWQCPTTAECLKHFPPKPVYYQPNGTGVPNPTFRNQPGQTQEGFWTEVPRIYPEHEPHMPQLTRLMVDIGDLW